MDRNGVLECKGKTVIPRDGRATVLESSHDSSLSGHFAIDGLECQGIISGRIPEMI